MLSIIAKAVLFQFRKNRKGTEDDECRGRPKEPITDKNMKIKDKVILVDGKMKVIEIGDLKNALNV